MTNRDLVHIALFAALTAVLGLFPPIPLPVIAVPITAQSLGPMLAGSVLGARKGFLSQALFLALVAVGLPLLSGGRGGFAIFAGPTAGFALSWPLAALLIGFLIERSWAGLTLAQAIPCNLAGGIVLSYLIGVPWIAVVVKLSPLQALLGSLPFVPGDIAKAVVAALVAVSVKKSYPIIGT